MAKALIAYYSRSGNTQKMAKIISDALGQEGIEVSLKNIKEITASDLLTTDAIIIGSPTYYGSMAYEIKQLIDESVKFHGKLDGKIGAAFATSANIAGGNETTILDILHTMLIHGMIIQGDPLGDHYGPVSIGSPDERAKKNCLRLAKRLAVLIKKHF